MNLVLPKQYVLCEDELYTIGSGYWTHVGHAQWTWTFTRGDCANISWIMSVGATLSSALSYYSPAVSPYASAISSVLGFGAKVFNTGSRGNGIRVYFHTMVWGRTPRWAQFI